MEKRRRGSQLLKVIRSSCQRNKQYSHVLSVVDRGEKITDFYPLELRISIFEIAQKVKCLHTTVYSDF